MSVTSVISEQPILIGVLIFQLVRLLLGFIDFFYRSSPFRWLLTTLFPLVKLGVVLSCFLDIRVQGKLEYTAYLALAELAVAQLAFVSLLFSRKTRDSAYFYFLVLLVSENLLSAYTGNLLPVWNGVYRQVLTLAGK